MACSFIRLQFIDQSNSIHFRHTDVTYDQLRMSRQCFLPALFTIGSLYYFKIIPEIVFQIESEIFIVFYQQNRQRFGKAVCIVHQWDTFGRWGACVILINRFRLNEQLFINGRLQWNLYREGASLPRLTGYIARSTMHFNELFGDRQADAGTLVQHRWVYIVLKKTVEYHILFIC